MGFRGREPRKITGSHVSELHSGLWGKRMASWLSAVEGHCWQGPLLGSSPRAWHNAHAIVAEWMAG